DPRSIELSLFWAPGDADALGHFSSLGIARGILAVPWSTATPFSACWTTTLRWCSGLPVDSTAAPGVTCRHAGTLARETYHAAPSGADAGRLRAVPDDVRGPDRARRRDVTGRLRCRDPRAPGEGSRRASQPGAARADRAAPARRSRAGRVPADSVPDGQPARDGAVLLSDAGGRDPRLHPTRGKERRRRHARHRLASGRTRRAALRRLEGPHAPRQRAEGGGDPDAVARRARRAPQREAQAARWPPPHGTPV